MLKENEVESYAYGAYGNPVELLVTQDILSSGPLYTGKEFDSRTRTYYFGARFFDPDLGVWLTPDPAGQYANAYGTGGDLINLVDLYGLWEVGLLISFGYTSEGGFSLGYGLGAKDIGVDGLNVNAFLGTSYSLRNGEKTSSISFGLDVCAGLCAGFDLSYVKNGNFESTNISGLIGAGVPFANAGSEFGRNDYYWNGRQYGGDYYQGFFISLANIKFSRGHSYGRGTIQSGIYTRVGGYGIGYNDHSKYGSNYSAQGTLASISLMDGNVDYIGEKLVKSLLEWEPKDPAKVEYSATGFIQELTGTTWCGSGGWGSTAGETNGGCARHDAGYRAVEGVEGGAVTAFLNTSIPITTEDIMLAFTANSAIKNEPWAGSLVGGLFTIISVYKTGVILAKDFFYYNNLTQNPTSFHRGQF
jgi:RHS repeat-associated protein